LLINGRAIQPKHGKLTVWVTGELKPKIIRLKGKPGSYYAPVRFEGIDAPEAHYRSTAFKLKIGGQTRSFPVDSSVRHEERSQPQWSPATDYAVSTLEKAGWGLAMLDREVTDKYGRVLAYVYASDSRASKKTFVSLQLVKRGLAFPFLFESAGSLISVFLSAAAKAKRRRLGVWRNYRHRSLTYTQTYSAARRHTDPEPAGQQNGPINLPVVFRRIVDAKQLKNLTLKLALQKYDAMDFTTGALVTGDQYHTIAVENLIWAPHTFT
jgi:endonuclease YncB( thermonuclease family)